MIDIPKGVSPQEPTTLYCTQCGQAMRVAPEHIRMAVACPHCDQAVEPWRVARTAGRPPLPHGASLPASVPPPPGVPAGHRYPHDQGREVVYSWRNRWIAGLLGIVLGAFGVHRMYLGYTGIGILQAALTVGSFFILSPVIAVWGLIEGVLCMVGAMWDVDGLPLSG